MAKRTCSKSGCFSLVTGKGYCRLHLAWYEREMKAEREPDPFTADSYRRDCRECGSEMIIPLHSKRTLCPVCAHPAEVRRRTAKAEPVRRPRAALSEAQLRPPKPIVWLSPTLRIYGAGYVHDTDAGMPQHRWVMEQMLGRKLVRGESVHHKNGIRHDNRPDNLELWIGGIRYGQRAIDLSCPHCGEKYSQF